MAIKAVHRLYEFLNFKSIPPTRLEREIGISNGYFGTQLKNGGDIGEQKLKMLIEYFQDLNPVWLLTGIGEMLNDENANPESQDLQVYNKKEKKRGDVDKEKSLIFSIERMTETADRNSKTLEKIVDYLINENRLEKGEFVKRVKSNNDAVNSAKCATAG